MRDWSEEGEVERNMCYGPIKDEFRKYFPKCVNAEGKKYRVLLPGAGLGRLVYDFAVEGYAA